MKALIVASAAFLLSMGSAHALTCTEAQAKYDAAVAAAMAQRNTDIQTNWNAFAANEAQADTILKSEMAHIESDFRAAASRVKADQSSQDMNSLSAQRLERENAAIAARRSISNTHVSAYSAQDEASIKAYNSAVSSAQAQYSLDRLRCLLGL